MTNELIKFTEEDNELLAMMGTDLDCVDVPNAEDVILPRLAIAQPLSEVLKKKNEVKFIEGAEAGCIYNTVTKEVFKGDEGMIFVPSKVIITYVEWADRNSGGGLLNNFGTDASAYLKAAKNEKGGRIGSEPGSEIIKTFNVYGYVIKDGEFTQAWIPMSKSQAKVAQKLITLSLMLQDKATKKTLPAFAGCYKLTTIGESNTKGDWFSFSIEYQGLTVLIPEIGVAVYQAAKNFYLNLSKDPITSAVADEDDRL